MANKPTLTDKQEAFAIEYNLNKGNATAAYKKCYDVGEDTTDGAIWVNAHRTLKNAKVELRIAELRKQRFSKKILSIDERKILLSEWAEDGDSKAVDLLNKMEGVYVEKSQIEHSGQIVQRTINVNPTKKKDGN
jgi:hypothetical protein